MPIADGIQVGVSVFGDTAIRYLRVRGQVPVGSRKDRQDAKGAKKNLNRFFLRSLREL